MKYILQLLLMFVLIIPFMIWECTISLWTFRFENVKILWADFKESVGDTYRRAFNLKKKSKFKTF